MARIYARKMKKRKNLMMDRLKTLPTTITSEELQNLEVEKGDKNLILIIMSSLKMTNNKISYL